MRDGSVDDLAARFLSGALPREEWTHAAHLTVGVWHVHQFGCEDAIARLRIGIRALNDRHGTANTDSSGYHETITIAYVRLIDQFLSACHRSLSVEAHVADLLAGPLGDRAVLHRFWSRDLLMSVTARATWVPPDLTPLVLPSDAAPSQK